MVYVGGEGVPSTVCVTIGDMHTSRCTRMYWSSSLWCDKGAPFALWICIGLLASDNFGRLTNVLHLLCKVSSHTTSALTVFSLTILNEWSWTYMEHSSTSYTMYLPVCPSVWLTNSLFELRGWAWGGMCLQKGTVKELQKVHIMCKVRIGTVGLRQPWIQALHNNPLIAPNELHKPWIKRQSEDSTQERIHVYNAYPPKLNQDKG